MLLGVSIASILVVSVVAYVRSRDALADTVTAQLTSERETLGQRIEAHLDTVAGHAASLAENRMVVEALLEFDVGWSQLADRTLAPPERAALLDVQQDLLDDLPTRADNVDAEQLLPDEAAGRWLQHRYVVTGGASSDGGAEDEATFYERSHERFDPVLRSFTERFGFYDLSWSTPTAGSSTRWPRSWTSPRACAKDPSARATSHGWSTTSWPTHSPPRPPSPTTAAATC